MNKRDELHVLLVKAYRLADTPTEFRLVLTLWVALGFGNPLYG